MIVGMKSDKIQPLNGQKLPAQFHTDCGCRRRSGPPDHHSFCRPRAQPHDRDHRHLKPRLHQRLYRECHRAQLCRSKSQALCADRLLIDVTVGPLVGTGGYDLSGADHGLG